MEKRQEAELLVDARAQIGEGALWDDRQRVLYWVDITAGVVHCYDPDTAKDASVQVGQAVGTVVCRESGGLMLAVHHGFARFDMVSGALQIVADPESHIPTNRFNDGKCDPRGRFWAGTMAFDEAAGKGSLYCLEPDGSVRHLFGGVTVSNGIAWSADGRTMYYIDTPTRVISAFDFHLGSGNLSNRRALAQVPASLGYPDGMCIDSEGHLWVAMWGGGSVTRWDSRSGRLLGSYPMPVSQVASCAFGGDSLDELYVTSARINLGPATLEKEPLAGGLFRLRPGVTGVISPRYAG